MIADDLGQGHVIADDLGDGHVLAASSTVIVTAIVPGHALMAVAPPR
ncbi:MAG: hypothetical protein R2939_05525 [Kofleriaceae bacterium]